MPKVNFQQTPRNFNSKMYRQTSNCDSLIRKIRCFYYTYENVLSLEDKRHLLDIVQQIDRANKVLDARVRNNIHVFIDQTKKNYINR